MSEFTADFQRLLDEELGNYAARVLELLAAQVQAKNIVLTQDLLKSLSTEVMQATTQLVAQMRVEFHQYGRIQEMKNRIWSKGPPVEELEKFVRKRGVAAFEYVPGYKHGQFPLTEARAVSRIAWGISRARKRDQEGPRPRSWFAKTFYSSINRFLDAVTTRYAAQTGTHLSASLQF